MRRVSSKAFTYHASSRVFVAEDSDFRDEPLGRRFEMVSERTGAVLEFKYAGVEYDREGDLVKWEYVPADGSSVCKVVLYND